MEKKEKPALRYARREPKTTGRLNSRTDSQRGLNSQPETHSAEQAPQWLDAILNCLALGTAVENSEISRCPYGNWLRFYSVHLTWVQLRETLRKRFKRC